MPYDVSIDHEQKLVSSVWRGDIDEAVCVSYINDVWGIPEIGAYDELVDFRKVTTMDLSIEAIQRLVSRSRSVATPDAVARSALVATGDIMYGLSRMYVSFRDMDDAHQREWKVVDDIDEARRWLETR